MSTAEAILERLARVVCVERGLDPDGRPLKSSADNPFLTNWQIEADKMRDQVLVACSAGLLVPQSKAYRRKAAA
jgi:hypothetical protein